MSKITTFPFDKEKFDKIKEYRFGKNWPVVYIIESKRKKEAYIGETINAYSRSKQHYENIERRQLDNIHIISDEEYNKSAALDIESWLIQYMAADGQYVLQNGNLGLQNHDYYQRELYKSKFETIIWKELQEELLVKNDLSTLKNSDLFKFSPYKTLNEDQFDVAREIFKNLASGLHQRAIVNGKPGTGKTILAVYLFKLLKEEKETKDLKIGLVVPMTSLRKTLKKVFKNVKGLKSSMVIGPNDVVRERYDLLLVDEAHRLRRRLNITNYKAFDDINKKLGLDKSGNELDWILKSSSSQILFYDKNQSIRPSDIRPEEFYKINAKYFDLETQVRVLGGEAYIKFIEDIFALNKIGNRVFSNYDFKIYDNLDLMVKDLKKKDEELGLCRLVAGYAWPWHTRNGVKKYDIEIDGLKFIWNSTAQDWVNSKNAVNEVGCIHTVQGYDLNYVGVIIGPEVGYDPSINKFVIRRETYFDINGRAGITDEKELEGYIINIYKTLLTRGIRGTYIYVVDKNLRGYLKSVII